MKPVHENLTAPHPEKPPVPETNQPAKIRFAVYCGAAAFLLIPLWILITAYSAASNDAALYLCSVVLIFFIVVIRWDIVGYPLQFGFLITLLLIAYLHRGWIAPVVVLAILCLVRFSVRRSSAETPTELSFPLGDGTYYVAHGGNLRVMNHHRVSRSQVYALDIVRLNRVGMRAAGIYPKQLENYRIFADVVYSPCDGVITAAVSDIPDLLPGEMDKKHVAGNHLVIQLDGSDIYIGLAHLMQHSVAVQPGERVTLGRPLARVGNSGNTSEPHLHIHAKRGGNPKSILDGTGVPMRFGKRWLVRNSIVRTASRHSVPDIRTVENTLRS